MKKVLLVFGTRPEAIKMAPLITKLKTAKCFDIIICVTAQHREMLDSVLDLFTIIPDYDLDLMSEKQTVTDITTRVLAGMEKVLEQEQPDLVLVHGDTTTTMAAAMAAFYKQIPVGHVEAGLRSGNIYSPYPEEMNRRITSAIATLHFAPTEGNRQNLLKEGVDPQKIFVTGNTVIDALQMVVRSNYLFSVDSLNDLDFVQRRIILLTAHRRENWGEPMREIFSAIRKTLEDNPDTELIYPVHLNPVVRDLAYEVLGEMPRVHLIPPLDYEPFVNLMARSYLVLTDSGGIQEEAPALGKPVLVLRKETERPEAVAAGTVKIAGVNSASIYSMANVLINDREEYDRMARAVNPYGDGFASERIIDLVTEWLSRASRSD